MITCISKNLWRKRTKRFLAVLMAAVFLLMPRTAEAKDLSRPKQVTLSNDQASALTVRWEKVDNADGYQLQYVSARRFTKNFAKARTVKIQKNQDSYAIEGLKADTVYYVRVRAYRKVSGRTVYSAWSAKKKLRITFYPPETDRLVRAGEKAAVYWEEVKGATGYRLQYSTSPKFKKVKTVVVKGRTMKKLTGLNRKKTYYFRVQSYKKVGSKVYRSPWVTEDNEEAFTSSKIPDQVFRRMKGRSYPADDAGAAVKRRDLRYLRLWYVDFDGHKQLGEMVCHKDVARDLVDIYYELYLKEYPIESIRLIDDFDANDELSMEANNTSCFCYRNIGSTDRLSNHALGRAVDLNPLYNPQVFVDEYGIYPYPYGSEPYADRTKDFEHKIDPKDLAYKLFVRHGFEWGGYWDGKNDYMHFEKNTEEEP